MAAGVLVEADAVARLEGALAQALEANERLAALVERKREEIAQLREELAVRDGELERVNAELAVLKRMLFGRSSERAQPETAAGDANPDQLAHWTAAWLERIKNLYNAHEQLSVAWAGGAAAELELDRSRSCRQPVVDCR
jgi:chromosome segregation ATPase